MENQLEGNEIAVGGRYYNQFGNLELKGDVNYTLSGELTGNALNATATYQINENNGISGIVCIGLKKMEFSVPMEL